jgi:hypothetical protein
MGKSERDAKIGVNKIGTPKTQKDKRHKHSDALAASEQKDRQRRRCQADLEKVCLQK